VSFYHLTSFGTRHHACNLEEPCDWGQLCANSFCTRNIEGDWDLSFTGMKLGWLRSHSDFLLVCGVAQWPWELLQ
jgi:hypothetical protein